MSVRDRVVLLLALALCTVLASCGGGSSSTQVTPPPPPPSVIPTSLNGTYVISYSGMDVNASTGGSSPFAMVGALIADGKGNITGGLIDLNDLDLSTTLSAATNVQTGLATTGTYTIGNDGRGTGSLNFTVNGSKVQFGLDFVLISSSHGLITRFDNSGSGSGTIDLQTSASSTSFQSLAFSLFGADSNGFPLASVGGITVSSSGSVAGTQDFNENGTSTGSSGLTLAGTSSLVFTSGTNGTAEFDSSFGALAFDVWVIDSSHLKFIETDATGAVLSGDAFTQQTSFPAGQLVFTLGGMDSGLRPFAAGGLLTSDVNGNMNGFEDFNDSGHFTTAPNVNASCTTFVAGRCQLVFTGFNNGVSNTFQFAAYPTSGGIFLLEIDNFGLAQGAAYAQTATAFAESQSYGLNLSGYNGGEVDDIAQFTAGAPRTSPNMTPGTWDEDDFGVLVSAAPVSGTYTPASLAPGRGAIAVTVNSTKTQQATVNLEYYVIDSSTIAFIETDPGQIGVGTFQLQNVSAATPLAQSHVSAVRPIIEPRATHNNCPNYGTCPAPAEPLQVWNMAGASFSTTTPAAGSWVNQFEGLDATTILNSLQAPREQPDPNGAVGPTIVNGGEGQYLEFADNYVQAYDRTTGSGIFSSTVNGPAVPQPLSSLFSGSGTCVGPSLDGIASYDRIDSAFVLANIFNQVSSINGVKFSTYYLCIAVSAPVGPVPASNLAGFNGQNAWNAYQYTLMPALPINPNAVNPNTPYFPDYLRFGTWSDGFYVSWDLEDSANSYNIVGFEVCQLDKADILAGLSSTSPACYTYIPNYVVNGTDRSLIHTLLPADFEGTNPIPGNTAGEYFLALVNPRNPGTNVQCSVSPCTSNQLAFWTWSGLTQGAAPAFVTLPTHSFTPGCYNPHLPYNTYCIPEPTDANVPVPNSIDGLGDRLGYRLAYRFIPGTSNGEYLAVAHTIQEDITTQRTGLRYYKILAGSTPQTVLAGDIQDATDKYFLSMPSVAMDKDGNLGITYTVTGSTASGSVGDYDPSPFFVTVDSSGNQGTSVPILANSGSSGLDGTDQYWGEYVSVTTDPDDDSTFWAVDEYMAGDQYQTGNCSVRHGTGCTWASRIFVCKKGSGC
jgi:hypothetical protein